MNIILHLSLNSRLIVLLNVYQLRLIGHNNDLYLSCVTRNPVFVVPMQLNFSPISAVS